MGVWSSQSMTTQVHVNSPNLATRWRARQKEGGKLLHRKDWDEAAQTWLDFVRKGKDYHRDELNNPAAFGIIGNIKGQTLLDMACGEGYNTRILAKRSAEVVGIDFSEKMIELAKMEEEKERLGISYHVMNAADLKAFPGNHFDLVTVSCRFKTSGTSRRRYLRRRGF